MLVIRRSFRAHRLRICDPLLITFFHTTRLHHTYISSIKHLKELPSLISKASVRTGACTCRCDVDVTGRQRFEIDWLTPLGRMSWWPVQLHGSLFSVCLSLIEKYTTMQWFTKWCFFSASYWGELYRYCTMPVPWVSGLFFSQVLLSKLWPPVVTCAFGFALHLLLPKKAFINVLFPYVLQYRHCNIPLMHFSSKSHNST